MTDPERPSPPTREPELDADADADAGVSVQATEAIDLDQTRPFWLPVAAQSSAAEPRPSMPSGERWSPWAPPRTTPEPLVPPEARSAEGRSPEARSAEGPSPEARSAEVRSAEVRSAEGQPLVLLSPPPAPSDTGTEPGWPGAGPWSSAPPGGQFPAPSGQRGEPGQPGRLGAGVLVGLAAGALAIALVAALLGGLAGGLVAYRWRASTAPALPAMPRGSTQRPAGSIAAIAAAALPSVVTIQVHGQNEESGGTGSGFVLRADGYLLTNNHVVADAVGAITVLFSDGSKAGATVTGKDASYDLAVLKVQRTGLRALALGDSDAVVVGDQVIAVGAPLGLDSTVTSGIVSAVDRPVTPGGEQSQAFINAIQTDAAINPGNSGGPLLDMSGRVIGINSAIARIPGSGLTGQSGNIGVGFAIPSAQARTTAEQLIATGKAQHPIIGVLLDPDYDGPGIKVSGTAQNGREPVTKDGPADRAGLKPGDVITKLDGKAVADSSEFVVAIRAHKVGDRIRITVRHAGAERTVLVTLQGSSE